MTTINFEKELYSKSAIKQAINDFSAFVQGNVSEKEGVLRVDLKVLKGETEQVKKEFGNYVLGLTKEMC